MDYEIDRVRTCGSTTEYLKFGKGEKTMVILPGLSLVSVLTSAREIVNAYSVFTEKYTVYLFDRRKDIPKDYSVKDAAADIRSALKVLGLKDIYLYGVSMGGMTAQKLAIDCPELVVKLALASTLCKCDENCKSVTSVWKNLAKTHDIARLNRTFFERIYSAETLLYNAELFKRSENIGSVADCEKFYVLANSIENFDLSGEIEKIKCPTLVLGSENDRVVTLKSLTFIKSKIPCEIYLYKNFGHAVYDEAPDFKERIFEFFER